MIGRGQRGKRDRQAAVLSASDVKRSPDVGGTRTIDAVAVVTAMLCVLLAGTARNTLNPDGVSYFDLVAALRHADWDHFVQGYWSPLYPVLLAPMATGAWQGGSGLVHWAHGFNAMCALATVAIIWRWTRGLPDPVFGRAGMAALLLAAGGPPTVHLVTPDVLLLFLVTWLTYEMLAHLGRRWLRVGLLLGFVFLAKTSAWPWLVMGFPLRWWLARGVPARRAVLRSTMVAVAITLLWIVPMSRKEGRLTLGSVGQLNSCWYLEQCDGQTPDRHEGRHQNYREVPVNGVNGSLPITEVLFDQSTAYTYQPWSDPVAWARGTLSRTTKPPTVGWLASYWRNGAGDVFGKWLSPLLLAVLLPLVLTRRRPGMWRALLGDRRNELLAMILGLMGLAQFIAVHAEPRLIAPFAMMFALGVLMWLCDTAVEPPSPEPSARTSATVLRQSTSALVFVAVFLTTRARMSEGRYPTDQARLGADSMALTSVSESRIVIVGEAIPVVDAVYRAGGHIVAQILPRSAAALATLPGRRIPLVREWFHGIADAAWFVQKDGTFVIVAVEPENGS